MVNLTELKSEMKAEINLGFYIDFDVPEDQFPLMIDGIGTRAATIEEITLWKYMKRLENVLIAGKYVLYADPVYSKQDEEDLKPLRQAVENIYADNRGDYQNVIDDGQRS